MSDIWIPAQSPLALALREPNLLVPWKKPVGAVALSNTPLARGVYRALVADAAGFLDVKNNSITPMAGSCVLSANQYGTTVYNGGGTSPMPASQLYPYGVGITAMTIVTFDAATDLQVLWYDGSANSNGFSGSNIRELHFGYYNNEIYFSGQLAAANTNTLANPAHTVIAGHTYVMVGGIDDDGKVFLYARDILTGATYSAYNATAQGADEGYLSNYNYVNMCGTTSRNLDGATSLFVSWDRTLSEAEINQLLSHPFSVLRPANDAPYLFSIPGGGAGADYTEAATLSATGTLAAAETYSADYPESAALSATGTTTAAETYSADYPEAAALAATGTLAAAEAYSAAYPENAALSATGALAVVDAYSAAYAEAAALAASAAISVNDAYAAANDYAESATVSATGAVAASEAYSAAYPESAALAATGAVVAAETYSAEYPEAAALAATGTLAASELYETGNDYAETAAVTATGTVAVADTYYTPPQYTDSAALSAVGAVAVSEAFTAAYPEVAALLAGGTITAGESYLAQFSDSAAVTAAGSITVSDTYYDGIGEVMDGLVHWRRATTRNVRTERTLANLDDGHDLET